MPSPKLVPLNLTDDERRTLTAWSRRRKTAQALAQRSRIILACAEGGSNSAVAAGLGVSRDMVSKWRSRFAESRPEGLTDEPRPGRPGTVSDEQVEAVITAALEQAPPKGDTHWSTRSMARSQGMSQSAASWIWRAFGLKPHLVETWKLSADPQFIEKVRDVVGLSMAPPENALVLCVDAKSQIQALDRTAPCLPMLPTTPARITHDYLRNGTTSLFAAFDLASGSVIAQPYRRHRHQEFLPFLKLIDAAAPKDLDLHLVRQLRHAQDPRDQGLAAEAPPVPPALHPDQFQLAQPRALVRRAHQPETLQVSPPQRYRARERHPQVDHRVEQGPQAVRVDQDR